MTEKTDKLTVVVTGATGMVGYHTVKRFLADGHHVRACCRDRKKAKSLNLLNNLPGKLDIIYVDINDFANLEKCTQKADIAVHCAGIVNPYANKKEIYHTNVNGTKTILAAAQASKVKHFLHISSLSVITGQKDQYNVDEKAPLQYSGEAYTDSKIDAEHAVMNYFGLGSMMVTTLRPGFIYGPQEQAWMPRLIHNLKTRKAMLIDGGTKQTNVIYIENLISAIQLACLNKHANYQIYNLTDDEIISKKLLFDTICDELNFPRITKKVPSFIAYPVCELISLFASSLDQKNRQRFSRFSKAAYRLAGINQGFDISKAQRELGYTNKIPFQEGMAQTLKHFGNSSIIQTPVNT